MSIFKAYDVRGLVDTEITADFCFATGLSLVGLAGKHIIMAVSSMCHDMLGRCPKSALPV
jgi:hypothetical protein